MSLPDRQDSDVSPLALHIASFIIATVLFSLLYVYLKVVWMVLLLLAAIGWFGLPSGDEGKVHRHRYIVFVAALAVSGVVGVFVA